MSALLVFGFTCAAVAQAQQCPLPIPTFLDEVRAENVRDEQGAASEQKTQTQRKVRIAKVDLETSTQLPPAFEREVLRKLVGRTYKVGGETGSTPEWVEEIQERMRYAFQERGYFRALIAEPKIFTVRESGDSTDVHLLFAIEPGAVYRLGEITFQHETVFTPAQLRALFELRCGDLFNIDQIRKGLDRMRKVYGTKGYVNVTPIPDTIVRAHEPTIDLVVDVDEGRQLRIGELEFIGVHAEQLSRLAEQHGLHAGMSTWDALEAFEVEAFKRDLLNSSEIEETKQMIHETYVSVDLRIGAPVCPTETSAVR